MTVNRTNKFNNDALISTAGTAIIGGSGFALAGYDSKPWMKNGVPSDEFVKKVEDKLLAKLDKSQAADVRFFDKFMENVGKAKSYEELADVNLKYFTDQKMPFGQMKQLIQSQVISLLNAIYPGGAAVDNEIDDALDFYNAVKKSSNIDDLKSALVKKLKQDSAGMGFEFVQQKVKGMYEYIGIMYGLDTRSAAQDAITSSFDVVKQNFNKKPENVSKEMFDIIKKTAKNMQFKTAALCGLMGGAVFGTIVYFVNKLCARKSGRKIQAKVSLKTPAAPQKQLQKPSVEQIQAQIPSSSDGNLLRKKLSGDL